MHFNLWYVDVDHEEHKQFDNLQDLIKFIILEIGMDSVAAVDMIDENLNEAHYIKVRP